MRKTKVNLVEFKRDPKEVERNEDKTPNIKYYFKSLWRKFPRLLSINLIMLFQIIPILIGIYAYMALMPRISVYSNPLFPAIQGMHVISASPVTSTLTSLYGETMNLPTIAFGSGMIVIIICAIFLMLTFGWQNVGSNYLMRELIKGHPVFIISDYFYAIKKNLKQGFFVGVFDFLISAILVFDLIYFYNSTPTFGNNLMFWGVCGVGIIYLFMRFYIYLMLITFDLSTRKIIKNALIFTALGFKRNILAGLWIVVIAVINLALFLVFLPLNVIIPLILPLIYFSAFELFTKVYAAYPIIKKFMIDPYYDEDGNPRPKEEEQTA